MITDTGFHLRLLFLAATLLSAGPASAQQLDSRKLHATAKDDVPRSSIAKAAKPCAEYGPGFVRVEGTSTCVQIGGSISVGVGARTGR